MYEKSLLYLITGVGIVLSKWNLPDVVNIDRDEKVILRKRY